MAALGLDKLVDFLLAEIALCGSQGAGSAEFYRFVNDFYRDAQGTSISAEFAIPAGEFGRKFYERAWEWLTSHRDVQIVCRDKVLRNVSLPTFETFETNASCTDRATSSTTAHVSLASQRSSERSVARPSAECLAIGDALHQHLRGKGRDVSRAAFARPDQLLRLRPNSNPQKPARRPVNNTQAERKCLVQDSEATRYSTTQSGSGVPLDVHESASELGLTRKWRDPRKMPRGIQVPGPIFDEPSPSTTAPRLYASQNAMWQAVTGHPIDLKKVPNKEFMLLSIVAAHGMNGITQPELVKLSGQDKRSVPHRTDELARKGYIEKKPVQAGKLRTSLCVHKKFVREDHFLKKPRNIDDVFRSGTFVLSGFVHILYDLLQDTGIVATRDLRKKLGVPLQKWNGRAVRGAIRRLNDTGFVKLVRARKPGSKDHYLPCVKLLRAPNDEDLKNLKFKSAVATDVNMERSLEEDDDGDALMRDIELDIIDHDTDSENEDKLNEIGRIPPQWTPDKLLANWIQDAVELAGVDSWDGGRVRDRVTGRSWKRPLEAFLSRLTDDWEQSQPLYLRHLALVRDTMITDEQKRVHYVYRTHGNFQKAVDQGYVAWEGVSKDVSKNPSQKRGRPRKNPQNDFALNAWGFKDLDHSDFHRKDGSSTLSESRATIRAGPRHNQTWDNALTKQMGYQKPDRLAGKNGKFSPSLAPDISVTEFAGSENDESSIQPQTPAKAKKSGVIPLLTKEQRLALGLAPKGRLGAHLEKQIVAHRKQTGDPTSVPDLITNDPDDKVRKVLKKPLLTKEERIAQGLPGAGRLSKALSDQIREERGLPKSVERVPKPRQKRGPKEPPLLTKAERVARGLPPVGRLPQAIIEKLRQERNAAKTYSSYDSQSSHDINETIANVTMENEPEINISREYGIGEDDTGDQSHLVNPDPNTGSPQTALLAPSLPTKRKTAQDTSTSGNTPKRLRINLDESPVTPHRDSPTVNYAQDGTESQSPPAASDLRARSHLSRNSLVQLEFTGDKPAKTQVEPREPGITVTLTTRSIGRGRPRKALMAVINSPRLKESVWARPDPNSISSPSIPNSRTVDGASQPMPIVQAESERQSPETNLDQQPSAERFAINSGIFTPSNKNSASIRAASSPNNATLPEVSRVPVSEELSNAPVLQAIGHEESQVLREKHPFSRLAPAGWNVINASSQKQPALYQSPYAVTFRAEPRPEPESSMHTELSIQAETSHINPSPNELHFSGNNPSRSELLSQDDYPPNESPTQSEHLLTDKRNDHIGTSAPMNIPRQTEEFAHIEAAAETDILIQTESPTQPGSTIQPGLSVSPTTLTQTPVGVEIENAHGDASCEVSSTAATPSAAEDVLIPSKNLKEPTIKKRGPIANRGVTLGRGNMWRFRTGIIRELLKRCSGVFPCNGEIALPFYTLWGQQAPKNMLRPDRSTLTSTINNMIRDPENGLKKMSFHIPGVDGRNLIQKFIIAYSHLASTSPEVEQLRLNMIQSYPKRYYPAEISDLVPEEKTPRKPQQLPEIDLSIGLGDLYPLLARKLDQRISASAKIRKQAAEKKKAQDAERRKAKAIKAERMISKQKNSKAESRKVQRQRLSRLGDESQGRKAHDTRKHARTLSNANRNEDDGAASDSSDDVPLAVLRRQPSCPDEGPTSTIIQRVVIESFSEAEAEPSESTKKRKYGNREESETWTNPVSRFYPNIGIFSTEFSLPGLVTAMPVKTTPKNAKNGKKRVRIAGTTDERAKKKVRINKQLLKADQPYVNDGLAGSDESPNHRSDPTLLERLTGLTGNPDDPIYHPPAKKGNRERLSERDRPARPKKSVKSVNRATPFDKLCITMIIARCMSAEEGSPDWTIVANVYKLDRSFDLARAKKMWTWAQENMAIELQSLSDDFESSFLPAYEAGDVDEIEDPDEYDWPSLVDWALRNCKLPESPSLPADRNALNDFVVDESDFEVLDRVAWYKQKIAAVNRAERIAKYAYVSPLPTSKKPKSPAVDDALRARSWIRSNTATPEELYNGQMAHDKLSTIGEPILGRVVEEFVDRKLLRMRKIKRQLPGRNYNFTATFAKFYRRSFQLGDFMAAAKLKKDMDIAFRQEDPEKRAFALSRTADDGAVMAVMSMVECGMIKLVPRLPAVNNDVHAPFPRLSIWGFCEGNYKHRNIPRERFFWQLDAVPTSSYQPGNPLQASSFNVMTEDDQLGDWPQLMEPPLPGKKNTGALLPIWSSIDGKSVIWSWWYRILNLVIQPLLFHPSATAADILQHCPKYTTEEFEIELVLEWLVSVNAAGKNHNNRYRVRGTFWAVFGDKLFDLEQDWIEKHVQRKKYTFVKESWREHFNKHFAEARLDKEDEEEVEVDGQYRPQSQLGLLANSELSDQILKNPRQQYRIAKKALKGHAKARKTQSELETAKIAGDQPQSPANPTYEDVVMPDALDAIPELEPQHRPQAQTNNPTVDVAMTDIDAQGSDADAEGEIDEEYFSPQSFGS